MTTATIGRQRRPLSDRAARALADGRRIKAEQQAAAREARAQADSLADLGRQLTGSSSTDQTTSQTPRHGASGSPAGLTTQEIEGPLAIAFDDSGEPPKDSAREPARAAQQRGRPRSVSPKPATATPKAEPKAGARGAPAAPSGQAVDATDEREAHIAASARRDSPLLAGLIILVARQIVGPAGQPQDILAVGMAQPSLRILYRHFPALAELSPDGRDGLELATAVGLYVQELRELRAAQLYNAGERRVKPSPNGYQPNGQQPIPIRRDPPTDAGRDLAPGQSAGYAEESPVRGDTAPGERYSVAGGGVASEGSIFADLGIDF